MERRFFFYIMTNPRRTVLYIGVTNNLPHRVYEHKEKLAASFASKYNAVDLVYYKIAETAEAAITIRTDDESLAPEGATVTGRIFRDGNSFSYTQIVNANGQVSFGLRTQLEGTEYTVIVDSVSDGGGSSFDAARECSSRTVTIGAGQGLCLPGGSH
jgi:predicted GIY-YIG superfamily endonuclease